MHKKHSKIALNSHRLFQKLFILLPMGIVGNLIFIYFTSEQSLFDLFYTFKIKSMIFCFLLSIFPWVTHSLRIFVWAKFLSQKVSLSQLLKIVIMSELGASASPTAIGGGPFKFGMLTQAGFKSGQALSLTILGSIEDYTFWILSVPVAMFFAGTIKLPFMSHLKNSLSHSQSIYIGILLLIILVTILFLNKLHIINIKNLFKWFRIPGKIRTIFQRTFNDFKLVYRSILGHGKSFFILNLILTSFQWIGKFSILIVLMSSLNISVSPLQFFFWQWIVFVTLTFIPTPGAAVGAEATFYLIFKNFIPGNYIGIITIAWRFFTYYSNLIIGTFILFLMNFFELLHEHFFSASSLLINVEAEENLTTNYE